MIDLTNCLRLVKHMMNHELQLDRMFQALADGHRRAIVERLTHGPRSVSDLAEPLPISLPAVMQHLAVLEGCGLVTSEKRGRVRKCRLSPEALARAEGWITARRRFVEHQLSGLAKFLTDEAQGEATDE